MYCYLKKTKLIYMTNALTQADLYRNQLERYGKFDFFYDCSASALIKNDAELDVNREFRSGNTHIAELETYFIYEQYKQIKFVFDRNPAVFYTAGYEKMWLPGSCSRALIY